MRISTLMPDESGTALTARAINEEISEWCEPKPTPESADDGRRYGLGLHPSPGGFWEWPKGWAKWVPRYDFPKDLNACAQFERLVRERKKTYAFVVELWREFGRTDWDIREMRGIDAIEVFDAFVDATPEQRCAAMLRVIRETR